MYVRFSLFRLYSVVAVCVGVCLSGTLRLSPLPVAPSTPPEGGQGGGFDWSVATHRSTRPQQSDRRPKKEREKKKKRRQKERGRTHWERAESKPPTHIVAGGSSFLRKRAVLAKGEDCVQAVQGQGQSGAQRSD